jgi:hypothetical protein
MEYSFRIKVSCLYYFSLQLQSDYATCMLTCDLPIYFIF